MGVQDLHVYLTADECYQRRGQCHPYLRLQNGGSRRGHPTLFSPHRGRSSHDCIATESQAFGASQTPFVLRFNGGLIKRILYIGVPNGLENSMFQLGKIMLLSLVSGFGTAAIAANAVGNT